MLMDRQHPEWDQFEELLEGPEGCNFQEDEAEKITWQCAGGYDKSKAEKLLNERWPDVDLQKTLRYFEDHGGHCDCEILFNVA
jgi:hypothetical protein